MSVGGASSAGMNSAYPQDAGAKRGVVSYQQGAGGAAAASPNAGAGTAVSTAPTPSQVDTPASTATASVPGGADASEIISNVSKLVYGSPATPPPGSKGNGEGDFFTKSSGEQGAASGREALANDALAAANSLSGGGDVFSSSKKET